ncbi:unnamed protein product [Closterium sp. Naga37s-1]|nr:unnamed protein product [Closterium sp. Naga37s-1]
MYEDKKSAKELKRAVDQAAMESALDAVSGAAPKKGKITDIYGSEVSCAKEEADEAICILFAASRIPENIANHPLWKHAKCRKPVESAFVPIAESWKRDGVTIASDMMTDRCGRPQANILLVNDSGAVFTEAVDCKMETKMGGFIASILSPVVDKTGPENVVALCTDGGSTYASAVKNVITRWPHIEHVL